MSGTEEPDELGSPWICERCGHFMVLTGRRGRSTSLCKDTGSEHRLVQYQSTEQALAIRNALLRSGRAQGQQSDRARSISSSSGCAECRIPSGSDAVGAPRISSGALGPWRCAKRRPSTVNTSGVMSDRPLASLATVAHVCLAAGAARYSCNLLLADTGRRAVDQLGLSCVDAHPRRTPHL